MKVYITKKNHYKFKYLANWKNPETGAVMGDWFISLKELKEYTAGWNAEYIFINE